MPSMPGPSLARMAGPAEWPRVIAHMDMDAFYVSVELQRRPELRGLPVVVAGSGPRAVVTTASYEARRFGVFSATPASRARRLCPQAVFVQPEFDHYRERSRAVMETVRRADRDRGGGGSGRGLPRPDRRWSSPKAAARRMKAAVREATGLACSIGIGPNKLVAKVASDADKPDGFLALTAAEARERFASHSPGLIPGIGPKSVERLSRAASRPWARSPRRPTPALAEWFGSRLGPHLGVPGAVRGRAADRDRADPQVGVARDHLRPRPARASRQLEPVLERLTGAALRPTWSATGGAGARWGSRCGWTTSPPTRAPGPSRAPVNDTPTVLRRGAGAAARPGPAAPRAPAGRAGGGAGRASAPADAGDGAEPQLELSPRSGDYRVVQHRAGGAEASLALEASVRSHSRPPT